MRFPMAANEGCYDGERELLLQICISCSFIFSYPSTACSCIAERVNYYYFDCLSVFGLVQAQQKLLDDFWKEERSES